MHAARWNGVSKNFGPVQALRDFTLEVRAGETLGLLGANGAGKSTALNLLMGLQKADGGEVCLFGQSPAQHAARARLGAVLQVSGLPARLTVQEVLVQHRRYFANTRSVDECMQLAQVEGLRTRRCQGLSGGERRRVEFAMALLGKPELLLLDEPTAGVDVVSKQGLLNTIAALKQAGAAIVLTTHLMDEVEKLADRVAVIKQGQLIALGTPDQLKRKHLQGGRIRAQSVLIVEQLRQLAGVQSVVTMTMGDPRFELQCRDTDQSLRAWMAEDPNISKIEVMPSSMEGVLVELMKEAA